MAVSTRLICRVEAIADVSALCEYQGVLWYGRKTTACLALDYASKGSPVTVNQGGTVRQMGSFGRW